MLSQRHILRSSRVRRSGARNDPFYGRGYRPDRGSILSVAHDEQNGGRVFIITDRPCMIADSYPGDAPLELPGLTGGAAVLQTQERLLPNKFALLYNMAIPRGAAWRWPENQLQIWDTAGGHPLNAGGGTIEDFPGPYVPIPLANVVSAAAMGYACELTFDRRIGLVSGAAVDDAIIFNGYTPLDVSPTSNTTLHFNLPEMVEAGSTWQIGYQPAWLFTQVTVPQGGTF